ncbi:hypothetical protein BGAL_0043g00040 [Botrytis galanthina]|uniref:Uncharacterized protein n=1 Tax=Botrytis galanthina TaxID=278940 RepID=A0A4S8RGJ8_9HELO|nr:hypothetical protein BGAL_0043g00040 [Botrytis galanthina]
MNVLLGSRKRGKGDKIFATPSTTSSANSSAHNVSTNASSSTQVESTACLSGGSGSGSNKHRDPKSHNASTNSSRTVVSGSSSKSVREGKPDSGTGNKSHREKDSNHGPGTSSSQASVKPSRPELKHASKSLLSLSRTKLDAEEREKDERLKKEHRELEKEKHESYDYVKANEAFKLEELRYQLAKTHSKTLEDDILAIEEEKTEQIKEVESKREDRNKAGEEYDKIFDDDEEIAKKQLNILREMSKENPYRKKAENYMKNKKSESEKQRIKQDKKERKDKEAATKAEEDKRQAEQKRLASEKKKTDKAESIIAERIKYKRVRATRETKPIEEEFERSKYNNSRNKGERVREREGNGKGMEKTDNTSQS